MHKRLASKVIKKSVLVMMALAVMIASAGCFQRHYTAEEQKALIVEGLKEKYGQEFISVHGWPSKPLRGGDMFHMYPKGGDPETDEFSLTAGSVYNKFWFADNYYGIYIKDEYEKVVRELLDKEFKEYKVELEMINNTTTVSRALDKDTTLDQIYDKTLAEYKEYGPKDDDYMMLFNPRIQVWISQSNAEILDVEAATMRSIKAMAAKKLVCDIHVKLLEDEKYDEYSKHKKDWYREYHVGINAEDLSVHDINVID